MLQHEGAKTQSEKRDRLAAETAADPVPVFQATAKDEYQQSCSAARDCGMKSFEKDS